VQGHVEAAAGERDGLVDGDGVVAQLPSLDLFVEDDDGAVHLHPVPHSGVRLDHERFDVEQIERPARGFAVDHQLDVERGGHRPGGERQLRARHRRRHVQVDGLGEGVAARTEEVLARDDAYLRVEAIGRGVHRLRGQDDDHCVVVDPVGSYRTTAVVIGQSVHEQRSGVDDRHHDRGQRPVQAGPGRGNRCC